jgi:hypothetical protein
MNCTKAREFFFELLDQRTAPAAQPLDAPRRSLQGEGGLDARTHLANCPDCQREFSSLSQTLAALEAMPSTPPTPRLRQNFYAMLEEEKNSAASLQVSVARERRARRISILGWILSPVAAVTLLVLGFLAGERRSVNPAPAADTATTQKLAQLEKQLGDMKHLMAISILQQQQNSPTNERLQEVLAAAKTDKPSEKVLNDLVSALAFDPSVNVRLRAIEALYKHVDNDSVRNGVLVALPREQNPLVQLEMIDFVAAAHDTNATPVLEKIAQDELIDSSVREAARTALAQL